ncbi:uncharacterized protein LOC113752237 [Coffea eugenioides]|uniref:uncharacterized protein LOC113752237 n=1 Tax=Coffea eugenioides TaxID=49369 RepID=UPI000F6104B8|nr:uncharacterized protein LOC113752237 [Coffea eugenioides]
MIRIHRFDNNAPSSLLNHSHSGFLSPAPSIFECLDANMSAKGMRISVSTEEELGSSMERKDAADDFGEPVVRGEEGFLSSVLKLHIFMVGIWEIDELGCLIICLFTPTEVDDKNKREDVYLQTVYLKKCLTTGNV